MPAHTAPLVSAYPVAPASNPPATVGLPNGVKGGPYCVAQASPPSLFATARMQHCAKPPAQQLVQQLLPSVSRPSQAAKQAPQPTLTREPSREPWQRSQWLNQQTEVTADALSPPIVKAHSQDAGKQESPKDLLLPASGLPPIPSHLVQAIRELKFVDLHDLLPEALRESQFSKTRESKDEKDKKKKFIINTPLDWAVAFATYTRVAVHCKPERAFELAAYASIVLSLARDVKGTAWSRYDLVFHQAAAGNHQLPWHRREPDIWLTAAMEASALPSTRPASHLDQPLAQRSSQICKRWNRGSCTYPLCKYRHVCFGCGESTHVTRDCPERAAQPTRRSPAAK